MNNLLIKHFVQKLLVIVICNILTATLFSVNRFTLMYNHMACLQSKLLD